MRRQREELLFERLSIIRQHSQVKVLQGMLRWEGNKIMVVCFRNSAYFFFFFFSAFIRW